MSMSGQLDNLLLNHLPAAEREQLIAQGKHVELPLGTVLHEPGAKQLHVWFPTSGVISLLYELADGDSAEVGIIGKEGMLGLPILMGDSRSPHRAVIQADGAALRLDANAVQALFESNASVRQAIQHYSQALSFQIGQTAVCNRHHRVEQQFCRWILMSIDRLPNDEVCMTQELIANMLGVRRAGVTEVAGRLRDADIISYQRGLIRVLDRAELGSRCCECYDVVCAEYSRLLPPAAIDNRN